MNFALTVAYHNGLNLALNMKRPNLNLGLKFAILILPSWNIKMKRCNKLGRGAMASRCEIG